jgi:hypothetical protein
VAHRVDFAATQHFVAFGAKRTLTSRAYRKRIYEYTPYGAGVTPMAASTSTLFQDRNRRCRTSRPDLGEQWPARLVATAEEDRLNTNVN